jgi:hypothetical protein
MGYQDFIDADAYPGRVSGAHVAILIYEEGVTSSPIIGGSSGINEGDDFEGIPIEEAGNDGVDEIVQGRHTGQATVQAFWSASRNDALPTRQTFIGRRWILLEVIAKDRPGAGQVVNAYLGCVMTSLRGAHGARGPKTIDMTFMYERRYNGKEWATLNGLL